MKEALDRYGITAKLAPTWYPDGYALKDVTVNETEFYSMKNLDQNRIVWHTGNYECSISGMFSSDEAKEIINSIYERN